MRVQLSGGPDDGRVAGVPADPNGYPDAVRTFHLRLVDVAGWSAEDLAQPVPIELYRHVGAGRYRHVKTDR